jgi:hypothetical protein
VQHSIRKNPLAFIRIEAISMAVLYMNMRFVSFEYKLSIHFVNLLCVTARRRAQSSH